MIHYPALEMPSIDAIDAAITREMNLCAKKEGYGCRHNITFYVVVFLSVLEFGVLCRNLSGLMFGSIKVLVVLGSIMHFVIA